MRKDKMNLGKLITLEGIDASGKTTHAKWISAYLEKKQISVCQTREPGGTEVGELIRNILLDNSNKLCDMSELLLLLAARRQHLHQVIQPHLNQGTWVICERFNDSTLAYQGAGRGMSLDTINRLIALSENGVEPDITLIFSLSLATQAQRVSERAPERFESESQVFMQRVAQYYKQLAKVDDERCILIPESSKEATELRLRAVLDALIDARCSLA